MTGLALALFLNIAEAGRDGAPRDFAEARRLDSWLRHPVYGDPSWDTFDRRPGNPVVRGADPLAWPVNGFLFRDPPTGHWYLYVGHYPRHYAFRADAPMRCIVYRSEDRGATWDELGPVFPDEPFTFAGDTAPLLHAPDVSVVYHNDRYHMVFDWLNADADWSTVHEQGGGVAYAWSERPEGPFSIAPRPVKRTEEIAPLHGKYRRVYAASLVRRAGDWLVLAMLDSGPHFGWMLTGMIADDPEGPWSDPVALRTVEADTYHPPLMECYPAFVHEGFVYAPATSVALNRSFQALFRAPVESAHDPDAWEAHQYGSLWHGTGRAHEYHGIWGQTFTGFVDASGDFQVMFPSRDEDGNGTINLARRPWANPLRDRGFRISAHTGPSLALLKPFWNTFSLDLQLERTGPVQLLWQYRAPLGPDEPRADATLHPLALTDHLALRLGGGAWSLTRLDAVGELTELARGETNLDGTIRVKLRQMSGGVRVDLNGQACWEGDAPAAEGRLALLLPPGSSAEVSRFEVAGEPLAGRLPLLYTHGLLDAAQRMADWETVTDTRFRYGVGAVSREGRGRAKWSYMGAGFALHAPVGPGYGRAEVRVDGRGAGIIDFSAPEPGPSRVMLEMATPDGPYHAVVVRPLEGRIPLDCLEVLPASPRGSTPPQARP